MKIKYFLLIILLLAVFLILNLVSYSNYVFAGLQDNIFRLHILANSDSEKDQALKLCVRDSVIDYMEKINSGSKTKEETIKVVSDNQILWKYQSSCWKL